MYRTHMKKRGVNLDKAYKGLPGISVTIDQEKCDGCGMCVDQCFSAAMVLKDGMAIISDSCKACGRCIDACPQEAVLLNMDDKEVVYKQLANRIKDVANIWVEE